MVPPLTGVAVKVIAVPAQIVVADEVMLTAGVTGVLMLTLVVATGDVQPLTVIITW